MELFYLGWSYYGMDLLWDGFIMGWSYYGMDLKWFPTIIFQLSAYCGQLKNDLSRSILMDV